MSEYWVSKKKYYCKYCEIYIADDEPSRKQHETGLRHKGNLDRFIRGIYKAGEKKKKDLADEKREMARVEQAAQAAFAQDLSSGHARQSAGPSKPSSVASSSKPNQKPSNPWANYSTAASLGFSDPDAARLAAQAAQQRTEGVAGHWEVVESIQSDDAHHTNEPRGDGGTVYAGVKREAEAPLDEDDTRRFKLQKKTLATGLGEIYDPGIIPIKVKKKEEDEEPKPPDLLQRVVSVEALSSSDSRKHSRATNTQMWVKPEWKEADDQETNYFDWDVNSSTMEQSNSPNELTLNNVKAEEVVGSLDGVPSVLETGPKEEYKETSLPKPPDVSAPIGLFKKRRGAAGGSRVR